MRARSRSLIGLVAVLFAVVPALTFAQQGTSEPKDLPLPNLEPQPIAQPFPAPVVVRAGSTEEGGVINPPPETVPSRLAATAGIRPRMEADNLTAKDAVARAAHSGGFGAGGALMIVGGAAFIAGLLIGGGAGTAVAVGGVLVGAYGLYIFLR
jgi:hypothetical protein